MVTTMTDTPYDVLIRGCTALTADPDDPVIEDAAIGIRGNRLALVGRAADAKNLTARRTIAADGHVATPGFVNVHTHAVLAMARGMTEDLGFAPAYTPGVPHLTYRINQTIVQQYGFTNLSLVSTLRILVSGLDVGEYRENGSAYPINVRLRSEDRQTIAGINSLGIPFGSDLVPLDSIASSEVGAWTKGMPRR